MKLIEVDPDELTVSPDLRRSGSAKAFEERLRSSIEEIGLAEPLKVAGLSNGGYIVIDGTLRLGAIKAIRLRDPSRFKTVEAYNFDYEQRFELRFQSDIYQDLLPSQLAQLVEHLHNTERVKKLDIARYIGVSPATLRNYTGLARLIGRGGLFAQIVTLMDARVLPASNPFAWLRLTAPGIRKVIEESIAEDDETAEAWIDARLGAAQHGDSLRYPVAFIETVTGALADEYYIASGAERSVKKDLGLRRGQRAQPNVVDLSPARRNLDLVVLNSDVPVLQSAARALREYLK
jgi:hypothetical protein